MSLLNQNIWGGVCGFVSILHALSERDGGLVGKKPAKRKKEGGKTLHQRLGAEMITYLRFVKFDKPAIADDIEAFSRSFENFEHFSIDDAMLSIDRAMRTHACFLLQWQFSAKLGLCGGVAMPLRAVEHYLDFVGLDYEIEVEGAARPFTQEEALKYRNCVVGVGNINTRTNPWKGLRHWVYIDADGGLWNWGKITPMTPSSARLYKEYSDKHNCIINVIAIR